MATSRIMKLISLFLVFQFTYALRCRVSPARRNLSNSPSRTSKSGQRYRNGASLIPRKSAEVRNLHSMETPKFHRLISTMETFLSGLSSPKVPWFESALKTVFQPVVGILRQSWWTFPLFLALVPLHCALQGTCAAMPVWWQLVNMDYVKVSKHATLLVSCFLGSNIAYFGSGLFLLQRFPLHLGIGAKSSEKKRRKKNKTTSTIATRFPMLGMWILGAGLTSTIFHSVQALGSYQIAESLCYIDHAVALSAGGYFWDTCGAPSRRTLGLGMLSLVTLALTHPGYAFLHSTWHFLSATTATLWALEGHDRMQKV